MNSKEYSREDNDNHIVLRRIEILAEYLDNKVKIPGTPFKFGFDAILGLIPGIGDTVSGLFSFYIIYHSSKMGVRKSSLLKMIYNVLIDVIFGVIPVIGDIFDFTWKANTKNIKLIHDDINTNNLRPRECSQSIIILILISIISFAFVLAVPTFIMIKLFEALFN